MGIIGYVIVFGLVLLILSPIIAGHFKNVRKDKLLLATLKDSGSAKGLSLTMTDAWKGAYAIGIDPEKRRLIYLRKAGESIQEELEDLSSVSDCRVDITSRTEKTPNGSMTVVEAVNLIIRYSDKTLSDKKLEFFNNKVFHSLAGERTLAEKWQKKISSILQTKNR